MTTTTSQPITVNQADTVHAVTRAICQKLLDKADYLGMLPSTRRDLAAVVADTSQPRYFNYMTFGEVDARGFERTRTTLRLDFERVDSLRQTEVASDGARYMVQRLRIIIETSAWTASGDTARLYQLDLARVLTEAERLEAEYCGRDLYLLLATAEEWAEQTRRMQRSMLTHFIETECKGLRVGQSKQVLCDVAAKLPGIADKTWRDIDTNGSSKATRYFDAIVANNSVYITRKT